MPDSEVEFQKAISRQVEHLHASLTSAKSEKSAVDQRIAELERRLILLQELSQESSPAANGKGQFIPSLLSRTQTADLVCELVGQAGEALHYRDIYSRLVAQGLKAPVSVDPASTILSRFYNDPRLRRTTAGTYGLAEWNQSGKHRDGSIPQTRRRRFKGTLPVAFQLLGERRQVNYWKDILVQTCTTVYELSPADFPQALDLKTQAGTPYFSRDSGNMRRPAELKRSGIFVETNLDADQIVVRCKEVLQILGLDDADFSVEVRT